MKFLKKIWGFLNSNVFKYIIILILMLFLIKTCKEVRENNRINDINEQNIIALNDSIKIEKLKNGSLQSSIAGYISDIRGLKDLNKNLYEQSQHQKGQLITLNRVVFQLKQDTFLLRKHINYLESIMSKPIQINDTTYSMDWFLKYNWDDVNFDSFAGRTYVGIKPNINFSWNDSLSNMVNFRNSFELTHYKTEMIDRLSQVELIYGQKIEDKKLRIFVNTKYPGFTTTSLEGVLIDPNTNPYIKKLMKKTQWFPNTFSIGVGTSTGFNIFTGKPYLGVGVTLNYNIFQW